MRQTIIALIAVVLAITLASCGDNTSEVELHEGEAQLPLGSSEVEERQYQEVADEFRDSGFTNVSFSVEEDLVTGWLAHDGEVEKVSVDGDFVFSEDDWTKTDAEIVIYYHTFASTEDESSDDASTGTAENTDTADTSSEVIEAPESNSEEPEDAVSKSDSNKITMPYGEQEYVDGDWTLEGLKAHFVELGFDAEKIEAKPVEPDDKRYKKTIFEISIKGNNHWEAGDMFKKKAGISIYYNEWPVLTPDNCPELQQILTDSNLEKQYHYDFANTYNGRYVEFEAIVVSHLTYNNGLDHVIDVSQDTAAEDLSKLSIRVDPAYFAEEFDESVQVGDRVFISGKIDQRQTEYFKHLYVKTIVMRKADS